MALDLQNLVNGPNAPLAELRQFPAREPFPEVGQTLEEIEANETAKLTEQLGQGIRAALGIGAMAILPELIAHLRMSKDPDARIKFLQLALKEGGYGTKDNKNDHLPTFNFNFHGTSGVVEVQRVKPNNVSDAVSVERKVIAGLDRFASMNDEVSEPDPVTVDVFDSIA